jgi:hypothetical protein
MRFEGAAKLCVYKATPGVHAVVGPERAETRGARHFFPDQH